MKNHLLTRIIQAIAAAGFLTGAGSAFAADLMGKLTLRPLTPQEIKDYQLTGAQGASGLTAIGIGQPAYLEALINIEIPASNIASITWVLTNRPIGSAAVLTESPLGPNIPTYKMVDRLTHQVAGRKVLVPDVTGQYVVEVTVQLTDGDAETMTLALSGATYMGLQTCALCHSGGVITENIHAGWTNTAHATFFTRAIDGMAGDHYGRNCISCHVLGYDTNAVNGGFDDVAAQLGWSFPAVLTNGNWAAMPQALKNLANIQCENCHGPGSEHAMALGNTNLSNWPRLGVGFEAGNCAQCHDSKPYHTKNLEWNNSRHAIAVEETGASCARCHAAEGFARYAAGLPAKAVPYEVITCAACHDPHDASNPEQLRTLNSVTLMDGKTTVTKDQAGIGITCMNCHQSRRNATNYVEVTTGNNRYGPHHGPQADMLLGANAMNFGKAIPSSAHRDVVEDTCVTCHMQSVPSSSPAFTLAGGHTFSMSAHTTNGHIEMVAACVDCHGPMTTFDMPRQDFDGDGVIQGVQTEVKGLLSKLAILLPPVGVPKPNHSATNLTITSSWTRPQLRAAYNYLFVVEDGSYGIHNLSYAVGLLRESIASLTGDANNDRLPDWWQIQYFGSASNPNAAPNATPAGDGVPNWLKYSLGLNPTVPGMALPDGVIWVNATNNVSGGTNTLRIYTAAEIAFNTEVGKTYQIQGTSSVSGGWVNVGAPIQGTGGSVSYVTPTRSNAQQFYRVVITP